MKEEAIYLFDWSDRHTREKIPDLCYVANEKFRYTEARVYDKNKGVASAVTVRVLLSADKLTAELPANLGGYRVERFFPNIREQISQGGY